MGISDWSSDVCSSDLTQAWRSAACLHRLGGRLTTRCLLRELGATVEALGPCVRHGRGLHRSEPEELGGLPLGSTQSLALGVHVDHHGGDCGGRPVLADVAVGRSEERRGGKECVSTCGSRWTPYHENKKLKQDTQQRCK